MIGHINTNPKETEELTCKIKQTPWDDYKVIKCPNTFKSLIRTVSRLVYPNNFTIKFYFQEKIITTPITCEKEFIEILDSINFSRDREIVLFVDIYKKVYSKKSSNMFTIDEVNEDLNNVHIDVNSAITPRCKYVKCL
jgi:hypothetical protein